SFELARSLRQQRHAHAGPVQVFVSAQRAPHLPDPEPPVHALPDNEFIEELRHLNGTPTEILQNAEVLELTLPLLRADFAICETYHYVPGEPLHSQTELLQALSQQLMPFLKYAPQRYG
ncbi:MAG TPA: thioesterase domain-containing protein, partial [Ktedonosporobacter sp.]|nr:thioesterase domain-containing protein [Ktedonosporobacter sp.]